MDTESRTAVERAADEELRTANTVNLSSVRFATSTFFKISTKSLISSLFSKAVTISLIAFSPAGGFTPSSFVHDINTKKDKLIK